MLHVDGKISAVLIAVLGDCASVLAQSFSTGMEGSNLNKTRESTWPKCMATAIISNCALADKGLEYCFKIFI